jgi:hypothetical protein
MFDPFGCGSAALRYLLFDVMTLSDIGGTMVNGIGSRREKCRTRKPGMRSSTFD